MVRTIIALIGGVAAILVLMFVAQGIGLVNLKFWAPKFEETRREVFEESQSFVHGKISHLNRLRLEYESSESETRRAALRTMLLQESAVLEEDDLPENLTQFLDSLRVQR